MQDEPTPEELTRAVADFLRDDVAPVLSGHNAFKLRVAINALDLVTRQLTLEEGSDAAEAARLSPADFVPTTTAPLLIACGAMETSEFLRQSDLLWEAWPQVRRPASAPMFVADTHHFSVVLEYARPESALTQATLGLLR